MGSLKSLGIVLIAGAAGATLALFMAPESGERTRRRFGRNVDNRKRRLVKALNRQKADLLKRGRATLDDVTDYVVDEIEHAQKKLAKVVPF